MLRRTLLSRTFSLGCVLVLLATGAHSETPGTLVLQWRAPEGCPSGAEVRLQVDRFLGGPVRLPGSSMEARATVTHDEAWRVSLETGSGDNLRKRSLEADSCRGLAEATALILALMIDPNAVAVHGASPAQASTPPSTATLEPSKGGQGRPIATPSPSPEAGDTRPIEPPPTSPPSGRSWQVALAPMLATEVGVLPALGWAIGAKADLVFGATRLGVAGRCGLDEPSTHLERLGAAGGKFRLVSGSLNVGRVLVRGTWNVGVLASLDVGSLRAEGIGVNRTEVQNTLWAAAGGGGFIAWSVGPNVAIPLDLSVLVPLARHRFVLDNLGEVFQPAAVVGRASIGVEFRF